MSTSIINARIFTGDASRPWAESLTFENGVITAVDGEPTGDIVDAKGRLVIPSFGDGHAHPMFGGFEFAGPAIGDAKSIADIQKAVRTFADANPDVPWILGGSYDTWIVPGGDFDATWLDEACADRPVVLRATDYHTVWCNTAALVAAGITAETPNPELGWIVRREDGSPMGTLREWDAVDLVLGAAPERTLEEKVRALEVASREMSRTGITWVQDAWVDPGMPEAYLEAARTGRLSIRYNLGLRAEPRNWREQLDWFTSTRASFDGLDLVTCNTIKFFADGVIEGHTAAVRGGYADDPHNNGMPVWDWDELRACVTAIDALGFQPHIHAIGDEGLAEAIGAIEAAQKANGAATHPRPVITHVQMLDPRDIPRFAAAGIVANFEPLWACNDELMSELTAPHIGPERTLWQYPMKSILDSGAPISMGSDWPVTDHNPLACMEIAITRQVTGDADVEVWNPKERLSVAEAITAYTTGTAYQAGVNATWGTIEVGRSADLAILSNNPFEMKPNDIHTVLVDDTWCEGRHVFSRNGAN